MREKGEEIASKGFFRRSMKFHPSEFVEPRVKVYLLNEGYACDAPKPGGPLTTRQPAEYKWLSGNPTPLQKIG